MSVFRIWLKASGVCLATPFAEAAAALIAIGLYRSLWASLRKENPGMDI